MTVHDAGRTCATLLVDLEIHPRVIIKTHINGRRIPLKRIHRTNGGERRRTEATRGLARNTTSVDLTRRTGV